MRTHWLEEDDNGEFHRVENPEAEDRGYDESRQREIDSMPAPGAA